MLILDDLKRFARRRLGNKKRAWRQRWSNDLGSYSEEVWQMSLDHQQAVRDYFEHRLREYTLASYRAYLARREHAPFLDEHKLKWEKWRENQLGLPAAVFDAYSFYVSTMNDQDRGAVRMYRVPTPAGETYAVRVTTDGDDSWLEVYDFQGEFIGAARAYLEIMAWGDQAWARAQVRDPELPGALRDAPQRTVWGATSS
jgi:hypothetical protein